MGNSCAGTKEKSHLDYSARTVRPRRVPIALHVIQEYTNAAILGNGVLQWMICVGGMPVDMYTGTGCVRYVDHITTIQEAKRYLTQHNTVGVKSLNALIVNVVCTGMTGPWVVFYCGNNNNSTTRREEVSGMERGWGQRSIHHIASISVPAHLHPQFARYIAQSCGRMPLQKHTNQLMLLWSKETHMISWIRIAGSIPQKAKIDSTSIWDLTHKRNLSTLSSAKEWLSDKQGLYKYTVLLINVSFPGNVDEFWVVFKHNLKAARVPWHLQRTCVTFLEQLRCKYKSQR
jgi:hypothetical protein